MREIEEALLYGVQDIRRGKLAKRGGEVIQRYCVIVKAISGTGFKIIIEPVDRGDGVWRCITAWKTK